MSEDIAKRVRQYIQIRDAIKYLEEKYEAQRRPLLEIQEQLAGRLRAFLGAGNLESLKTEHGTCYTSTRYTASLADPDAFMNYVIKNQLFELLDRRANATAVKDFVKKNSQEPPGCHLNGIQTIGVRRAPGS